MTSVCPECFGPFNSHFQREVSETTCNHSKCRECLVKSLLRCQQCPKLQPFDVDLAPDFDMEGRHQDVNVSVAEGCSNPTHCFIEMCVECFSVFNGNINRRMKDVCGHLRCRRCVCDKLHCRQCTHKWFFDAYNTATFKDGVVKLPCCVAAVEEMEIGRGVGSQDETAQPVE